MYASIWINIKNVTDYCSLAALKLSMTLHSLLIHNKMYVHTFFQHFRQQHKHKQYTFTKTHLWHLINKSCQKIIWLSRRRENILLTIKLHIKYDYLVVVMKMSLPSHMLYIMWFLAVLHEQNEQMFSIVSEEDDGGGLACGLLLIPLYRFFVIMVGSELSINFNIFK